MVFGIPERIRKPLLPIGAEIAYEFRCDGYARAYVRWRGGVSENYLRYADNEFGSTGRWELVPIAQNVYA